MIYAHKYNSLLLCSEVLYFCIRLLTVLVLFVFGASLLFSLALGNAFSAEPFNGLGVEFSGMRLRKEYDSSSNSISSSISSISRTSSESEHAMVVGAGDLEADADSLTCRQSGLSSNDQFENDGRRKVLFMSFVITFIWTTE